MGRPRNTNRTLTDRLAASLKPDPKKHVIVHDDEVPGLALRVTAGSGTKAWTLDDRLIGRPDIMTLAEARRFALRAIPTPKLRFLSVCSGIEAASCAFDRLGWQCVGLSELRRAPAWGFLEQRFPGVPLFADFRIIEANQVGPVDVLIGGPPCTDYSRAGKGKGVHGETGNYIFDFIELARRVAAPWFVFENASALTDADHSGTWREFLRRADAGGYSVAWRVLDTAQVGLPVERKRTWAVGYLGAADVPGRVVFERRPTRWPFPMDRVFKHGTRTSWPEGFAYSFDPTRGEKKRPQEERVRSFVSGHGNRYAVFYHTDDLIDDPQLRFMSAVEMERALGFPDGWSACSVRGKPASDWERGRLIGNAFSPAIAHWIGEGIADAVKRGA